MSKVLTTVLGGALIATAWFAGAQPDDRFASVEIKATHVAGAVRMLEGAGGNIGVSVGLDGVLIALERDGFGRWEEWGSGFIDTERWISLVRESDVAGNAP